MTDLFFIKNEQAFQMLPCDKHDLIEIACLYQLKLLLTLESGSQLKGSATDTCINDTREECIVILCEHNVVITVAFSQISSIQAVDHNPYFDILTLH